MATNEANRGKVCLMTATDRDIARTREGGRFSNAPDTKQQADMASALAKDIPVLMLLRLNGIEDKGWRGLPFWWPVLVVPKNSVTSIFAAEAPSEEPCTPDVPGVLAELGQARTAY